MSEVLHPEVLWAQRSSATDADKNVVYVTINEADLNPDTIKLDLKPNGLSFQGTNAKKTTFGVDMELFEEIDVNASKTHITPRGIDIILRKKETQTEYWPRLLKDKAKQHWLKTDFDKWVDEDEQEEAPEDDGFGGQFGGGADAGGFGNIDFSKLGGGMDMSGMGGMGEGGMEMDKDEDEEEEDDDEMPGLEEAEVKDAKPDTGKAKSED